MADFQIYQLPDEPITVFVSSENPLADITVGNSNEPFKNLLDVQARPVYHIVDLGQVSTVSLDQLINLAYQVGMADGAAFHHPALQEVLVVTTHPGLAAAAHGLSSAIYGNIPAHVFDSVDHALAYAREQIAVGR